MKTGMFQKLVVAVLLIALIAAILVIPNFANGSTVVHTLDATADLAAMAQGAKADGDAEKAGTDNFFTI